MHGGRFLKNVLIFEKKGGCVLTILKTPLLTIVSKGTVVRARTLDRDTRAYINARALLGTRAPCCS
jgi:hypothetical protein